ncbi:fibronectin type III domain-containing protein [Bacillus xiapuensis]|uniref:Fibronectin type III domain-containing protein n=1 Tax=Bacillus xiapuensis TaxID=2014075 RepID=A0ABU6N7Z0_9BACI|nr:fibronectin type III domain-containing protein [Bacillus xiapuensis]
MSQKIKIKRGLRINLPQQLDIGELAFCTDTKELFIGTTSGNYLLGSSGNGGAVDISDSANNGYLIINGQEIQVYDDSKLKLSHLIDVNLTNKTNGYVLTYNTIEDKLELKPLPNVGEVSVSGGIGAIDLLNGELIETNDLKRPLEISNLIITDKTRNSLTLRWDNSPSGDVSKYKIYKDGILLTTVDYYQNNIKIENLQIYTSYTFKVTSVDNSNNESNGVIIQAKTFGNALLMEGLSGDYLRAPTLTFDEVELDFETDKSNSKYYGYYFDGRFDIGVSSFSTSDNGEIIESYWSEVYLNNNLITSPNYSWLPSNTRVKVKLKHTNLSTIGTGSSYIFSRYGAGAYPRGILYSVKFIKQGVVQAYYDFETGTDIDQSGNGKSLVYNGGIWI